ncbi:Acetate kinase [Candidatus Zixiibacteriota bacterium]|nr:Acetate kinase [candidate division Zixibacteria bacterium]
MNILVVNAGSSSIKYQFFNMDEEKTLARGMVSRIGMSGAILTHKPYDRKEVKVSGEILDHIAAIGYVITILLSTNHGVIKDKSEIHAVGHRVVHGGERFTESILIDKEVLSEIRNLIDIAPLHNPHNIRGIQACEKTLPGIPQVAVFDTAFHHQMPAMAYVYGIPYVMYKNYGIRRYGFHGTSHSYVSHRAAEIIGKPIDKLKIVTCHLGNGASIAAVDRGVSVDTSMGFTPLEGLLMGTRSGDIDPAIPLWIMGREELSLNEANTLLNKHSGLIGISGVSSDMREIIDAAGKGNDNARLALDIYCYRLRKYIGAYAAAMGGIDAIVFTAGVGENSPVVRQLTCKGLEFLGVELDDSRNQAAVSKDMIISTDSAKLKVLAIPTNEELVIARDTKEIVEKIGQK